MTDPDSLTGRRILVTGGAGFIGSATVGALIAAGAGPVTVIDDMVRGRPANLDSAFAAAPDGHLRLITGDICDRALMEPLVANAGIVVHLAALRITQCAEEPRRAMDVMVNATYDLFDLCRLAGVRSIVYASTASVYGMATSFPTAEDHHPYDNDTLYGAAKLFGEGLLRTLAAQHGIAYTALRYFNAYGPRMDIHGRYTEVLIRWMERIEAGLPPIVFGDGLQTMDMIHVDDIARANVLAARRPAAPGGTVFNIGSGTETSLLGLAQALSRAMDRPGLTPEHLPERKVNKVPRRLADTSRAEHELGFRATTDLDAGLRGLVTWWRQERARS